MEVSLDLPFWLNTGLSPQQRIAYGQFEPFERIGIATATAARTQLAASHAQQHAASVPVRLPYQAKQTQYSAFMCVGTQRQSSAFIWNTRCNATQTQRGGTV